MHYEYATLMDKSEFNMDDLKHHRVRFEHGHHLTKIEFDKTMRGTPRNRAAFISSTAKKGILTVKDLP
jgi:hypothetical protein